MGDLAVGAAPQPQAPGREAPASVIVQGRDLDAAARAVHAAGGEITHKLGVIRSVGDRLPNAAPVDPDPPFDSRTPEPPDSPGDTARRWQVVEEPSELSRPVADKSTTADMAGNRPEPNGRQVW